MEANNKALVITKGMKIFHIYKDYSNREPMSQKTAYFNPYGSRSYNQFGNEHSNNSNNYPRPFNVTTSTVGNDSNANVNNTYGSFTVINSNFTPFNNQMIKEEVQINSFNRMKEVSHIVKNDGSYDLEDEVNSQQGDCEYEDSYKADGNAYEMIKVNDEQQENHAENYNQTENNDDMINEDGNHSNIKNIVQEDADELDDYEEEGNYISRYDRFS